MLTRWRGRGRGAILNFRVLQWESASRSPYPNVVEDTVAFSSCADVLTCARRPFPFQSGHHCLGYQSARDQILAETDLAKVFRIETKAVRVQ